MKHEDQPGVAERKPSRCDHSNWCARWVTESVVLENRPMLSRLYDATIPCSCGAEPPATSVQTELRSTCCDAPTRTANTDYNVCTSCREACDVTTVPVPQGNQPVQTCVKCSSCGGTTPPMRKDNRNQIACSTCFTRWAFPEGEHARFEIVPTPQGGSERPRAFFDAGFSRGGSEPELPQGWQEAFRDWANREDYGDTGQLYRAWESALMWATRIPAPSQAAG